MMKKSAKIMSVILSLAMGMSVFSLTACGETEPKPVPPNPPEPPAHTHTFDMNKWESDESEHWHPATCEHKTEKNGVDEHDTEGTDGGCSVCKRPHVHTFAEEWTYDEAERPGKHWHAATCIHFALIDGEADHVMENHACTVCGYEEHVHTFASEWSTSSYAHWKAATCAGDKADDVNIYADDSGRHTYDADNKCTVCDYRHTHSKDTDYWMVDETSHWHGYNCEHANTLTDKPDLANHDTNGKNGACTVCGWLPIVETPEKDAENNVINGHVHSFKWEASPDYHWKRIVCDWMKSNGCKSCDKGYYAHTPKVYDLTEHVFNEKGACECGYQYSSWTYATADCIECETCGGCIKTVCDHENEAEHKKCGHKHGADAKTVTLEAENGFLWKTDNSKPGISDYTGGKRDGIAIDNKVNVSWTITVNKATTVTLRLRCTRREGGAFENSGTVTVNGVELTTKTTMAQPTAKMEDAKCNPAWLTFGCIELKAGENVIEITQTGEGFNLDKIELITAADVTIDHTPIDNAWLTVLKQNVPIPREIKPQE